ncbi:uncharacterized protein LOC128214401 isoform X3 [Mya arenaria]|uniref:uncharacterized protein LOC128214401 isoform X3 n=1 Tax=Mya arenaria TaxID=6604 RepID=UPI0022E1E3CA|nr:uncharacterized protein LOC128214401 isoform X3 [Mya arenaria]
MVLFYVFVRRNSCLETVNINFKMVNKVSDTAMKKETLRGGCFEETDNCHLCSTLFTFGLELTKLVHRSTADPKGR